MKKILLPFIALSLSVNIASAQITLTQADAPIVGDTITIARDTLPVGIVVGAAGTAAQSWNFSTLKTHSISIDSVVSPASTPAAASFTSSNLAIDNGSFRTYLTSSSSKLIADGIHGDPMGAGLVITAKFNPVSTILKFPATHGNSFIDTTHFEVTFFIGQFGIDSGKISHYGYATKTIDAHGSLITPAATYSTTLRQYVNEETLDSIFIKLSGQPWSLAPTTLTAGFGYPNNPQIDTTYTYSWYANGQRWPIAEVEVDTVGGMTKNANHKIKNTGVGVPHAIEIAGNLDVFPNPASASFTINYASSAANERVEITLLNTLGQAVISKSKATVSGKYIETIDVQKLPKGVYLLRLLSKNGGTVSKKVIVE